MSSYSKRIISNLSDAVVAWGLLTALSALACVKSIARDEALLAAFSAVGTIATATYVLEAWKLRDELKRALR